MGSSTLRVAILGSRGYPSDYGGFETFVRHLVPHLQERGDSVTVYGRATQVRTTTAWVDDIETVCTAGIDDKALSTLLSGLTSSIHARRRRFDVALVLNCANGFWLPILRSRGIPTAVNVDGVEWERDKWGRLGKSVFRMGASATARFADRIIVDSAEIGRIWRQRFSVESTFIPYGADVVDDAGADRIRSLGLEHGTYLLVVARLVPENNIDLFLDALDRLPSDVPAVVVGSANYDSPVERRLRTMSARRSSLLVTGHVSDQVLLSQLWANCALYFHGHSVGGTNPALLQALGYGSPTLALETPFNREVLEEDRHMVPASAETLAHEMMALLADPERRRELSAHGRRIVAARYRWEDVCAQYRDALVELATRQVTP